MMFKSLFFGLIGLAVTGMAHAGDDDKSTVEAAVRAFARHGDTQDAKALEQTLHPDFRVVFTFAGDASISVLTREAYLGLVADKKLGGGERKVDVRKIDVVDDLAHAHVQMDRADMTFDSRMVLARSDGSWKVIEDAAVACKK